MSRIVLESKSPTWQKSDLRMTRVKDTDRGELLIFKELSWQTVRIEAKSTMSEDLTPLRLITNQARCRITIKKKLSGIYFFFREITHYVSIKLYDCIFWFQSYMLEFDEFCDILQYFNVRLRKFRNTTTVTKYANQFTRSISRQMYKNVFEFSNIFIYTCAYANLTNFSIKVIMFS